MTQLFAPTPTPRAEGEKPSAVAQLRQSLVYGGSIFGLGTAGWAIIELLKSEPDKGFKLLETWGPWCFLIGGALAVFYAVCMALIRSRAESDLRMAMVLDRLAAGQERIATAAETAAGKDDRQIQQMEILVTTVVMMQKRVMRRLHAQDRALERLEDKAGINRPAEDDEDEEPDTP